MPSAVWIALIVVCSSVSALCVVLVMRARGEASLARERQSVAEARGALDAQKQALEESLRTVEETTRRKALDEFLADIRVEERHYVRQNRVLFLNRKSLVVQERIYFRNIPLSNWVEQERVLEEGADPEAMARTLAVFDAAALPAANKKLLR